MEWSLKSLIIVLAAGVGEEPPSEPGVLFVTPAVLDFGVVPPDGSDTRDITVSNAAPAGNGDLELSNLSISGAPAFAVASGTCNVGTVLAPQQSCSVQVTFSPEDAGDFTAVVMIATTDGQDAAVELEGTSAHQASTELVSIQPGGGQFPFGVQYYPPAISTDGRYVAFRAHTPERDDIDLYRHDRTTGITEPASVDTNGDWINTQRFQDAVITADGRHVFFLSAFLLEPPEGVPVGRHIFMRDMEAGVTEWIAIPTADGEPQDPSLLVNGLAISADGRYIGFDTHASNLLPGGAEGRDVYVYDRQTETLERVSVASDGSAGANWSSSQPTLSADGRYVAFYSKASNLVPDDTNDEHDVFVRDRETGTTERVSVASDGTEGNAGSAFGSRTIDISADGRYVAFMSRATNLVPGDTNPLMKIFTHDRATGTTEQVSVASDGSPDNGFANFPAISANGRYVGFNSWGTNLDPDNPPTNGTADTFVHDRESGVTEMVSVASDGTPSNGGSQHGPALSADGRFVAFTSKATNLVTNDMSGDEEDVFVRDRIGGPPPLPDRIFDDHFEAQ